MKAGDLVRYRQGSLDKMGVVVTQKKDGDYWVQFFDDTLVPCRCRCLEIINESRRFSANK